MDEPTGSTNPIAIAEIEELLLHLRQDHAVVTITHSMMQARRIADRVACFHMGALREVAPADVLFSAAQNPDARAFVAGDIG